ncbi:uncharacterized protein [Diadema antillarum]|uniref:uncharacterized protein n=1 Tax=Diadema antillarum TaxID=105358 RepID=UPI003A85FAB3
MSVMNGNTTHTGKAIALPHTGDLPASKVSNPSSSNGTSDVLGNGKLPLTRDFNGNGPLPEFGKSLRDREFFFSPGIYPLNNGSYGAVPRKLLDIQYRMMQEREENAEMWYTFESMSFYMDAISRAADFVGAKSGNIVLVENATSATNSILNSFPFKPGDQILATSLNFRGVLKATEMLTLLRPDIGVVKVDIPFDTTARDIIDLHIQALDDNPRIVLALLDHIVCMSAILMPIRELIAACRSRGVITAVDGAHAPGQLALNLEELGADFYYGNFHKWCFTPRGCAIFYIHPKHHPWIRPAITSYGVSNLNIHKRFHPLGTQDCTPYYLLPYAIDFHSYLGGLERITDYNAKLLIWAAEMLAAAWKTTWSGRDPALRAPFMCLVNLPATPRLTKYTGIGYDGLLKLRLAIARESGVIAFVTTDGEQNMYVRLSAQVYNYREEYYELRDAVIKVLG